jgi:Holliday junction resolvase RusA-like endonuclease
MTKHDTQAGVADTRAIQAQPRAVSFLVPGKPQGKGRPRAVARGKFVRMYTPEKTASYESTGALAASQAMAGQTLIAGPVEVVMRLVLPIPMSWSNRKKDHALDGIIMPTTKPDADNVIKAIFDAINGVVWHDDTQVVDLQVRKRYGITPGVNVIVSQLEAC